MDGRVSVTESELLEAVREAIAGRPETGDDAFSVDELSEALSCHPATARKAIKGLMASQRAEAVRVKRRAMDGRLANVVAYRLLRAA